MCSFRSGGGDVVTPVKPNTHCGRLLAVLEDGRWHTTSNLYRRAGNMIVHSRIADLRAKGYRIEHDTVPGRGTGARAHRYIWLDAPTQTEPEQIQFALDTDTIAPRVPSERYRIFRVKNGGDPEIVGTVGSLEAIGPALKYWGEEGMFDDYCVGIQDSMARWQGVDSERGDTRFGRWVGDWIVKPWQAGTW